MPCCCKLRPRQPYTPNRTTKTVGLQMHMHDRSTPPLPCKQKQPEPHLNLVELVGDVVARHRRLPRRRRRGHHHRRQQPLQQQRGDVGAARQRGDGIIKRSLELLLRGWECG